MARGTCSVPECGMMSAARGMCGKHYQAAKKGKIGLPTTWQREKSSLWKTNEQRLLEKVYKDPETGCWIWQATLSCQGYGQTTFKNEDGKHQSVRAHRLAWMIYNGDKPAHLHIRHKCDNKACANPDHLELGTHTENMQDIHRRGNRKGKCSGENNGRSELSQIQADEIRAIYARGNLSQEAIGNMFGVSQFAISAIVRNKRYVTSTPIEPIQPEQARAVTRAKQARKPKQPTDQLPLL